MNLLILTMSSLVYWDVSLFSAAACLVGVALVAARMEELC
jgi:hypothetical protein